MGSYSGATCTVADSEEQSCSPRSDERDMGDDDGDGGGGGEGEAGDGDADGDGDTPAACHAAVSDQQGSTLLLHGNNAWRA